MSLTPTSDLTVVILTLNEEPNLAQALESITGWVKNVLVVDSGSTDRTLEIARAFGCRTVYHAFTDYGAQRNFAIFETDIETEWIFFLDADEWFTPELRLEIAEIIKSNPRANGFYVKRRMMWLGRWIRYGGYYPKWILRLFRRGTGRCDDRKVNEHMVVTGEIGKLHHDLVHEDRKGIGDWIAKHNRYAAMEAEIIVTGKKEIPPNVGGVVRRRLLLRRQVWDRLPLLIRPFLYFVYRYFLLLGFRDGAAGFIYHFLHALWYRLVIDAKLIEMSARTPGKRKSWA